VLYLYILKFFCLHPSHCLFSELSLVELAFDVVD